MNKKMRNSKMISKLITKKKQKMKRLKSIKLRHKLLIQKKIKFR